jgi:hypothetical protein
MGGNAVQSALHPAIWFGTRCSVCVDHGIECCRLALSRLVAMTRACMRLVISFTLASLLAAAVTAAASSSEESAIQPEDSALVGSICRTATSYSAIKTAE